MGPHGGPPGEGGGTNLLHSLKDPYGYKLTKFDADRSSGLGGDVDQKVSRKKKEKKREEFAKQYARYIHVYFVYKPGLKNLATQIKDVHEKLSKMSKVVYMYFCMCTE